MNILLIRSRFSMAAAAALLGTALILGACGGEQPGDVADPGAEEPAVEEPAAEEEAAETPETEVTVEVETEDAEAEAETEVETEVITETGVITTELITQTEVVTESEVTTDVEVIVGETVTETEGATETEGMTETEDATETEGITETEDATETEGVTETEGMTEPQGATEAGAAAATIAGISGAENAFVRATTLLDYNFENADGEVSGEIEDLILDLQNGRILFVPIEYGGFLEIGDTEIAMPLSAFRIGDEGELVLNFDEQALQNFPDQGGDWPNLDDPAWDDAVNTFWAETGIPTGGDITEATGSVARASELLGLAVADAGAGAGTIQDMIVDLGAAQSKYFLIDVETGLDEGPIVVPFGAFNILDRAEGLNWTEDFDPVWLEQAPRWDVERFGPDQPLDETWDDDFNTFWSDLGFDVDVEAE